MYVFLINIQVITMGNRKSAPRSTAHSKKESEGSASAPKPLPPAIHTDAVNSVTFCGSPWVVASGGQDNKIVVSDWKKEKKACSWQGHSRGVTKILYSRSKQCLYSSSRDKCITQWNLQGQEERKFTGHDMAVTGIALSGDGDKLASGSRDGFIYSWDCNTGQQTAKKHLSRNVVTSLTWIEGSQLFAQTSEDKIVHIWDSRSLENVIDFPRQNYFQTCCASSPDGNYVLTGSNGFEGHGCLVSIWDVRTKEKVLDLAGHSQRITDCSFIEGRDGLRALSTSADGTVGIWNVDKGTKIASSSPKSDSTILTSLAPIRGPGGVINICVGASSGYIYVFGVRGDDDNTHLNEVIIL
eukprot:m.25660 g.25660  ORF g.25660 m.25660 type:complete len:354 (+) comp7726_c0_seq4:574-1635(+)